MDQDLLQEDVTALAQRLERIDELADEFEQNWTPPAKNTIERFLARSHSSLRPALAVELVKLELELRANRGEPLELADYFVRLPQLISPTGWPDDELVRYADRLPRKRGESGFPQTLWESPTGFRVTQRRNVALRPTTYDVIDHRPAEGRSKESAALLTLYPPMIKANVDEATSRIHAWERVDPPIIPRVRELGSLGGCLYVLQDPVDGASLAQLASQPELNWRDAVRLTIEAAKRVGSVHAKGMSHGLLSPHAIVQTRDGGMQLLGMPTVPDAVVSSPAATDPRLGWLCPENAWNFPRVDQKAADGFAVGAVLYHLLAGQALYVATDTKQVLAKALACAFDEKPLVAKRVPSRIRDVCKKAVQRNPEHRYPNMDAFIADLTQATNKSRTLLGWLGR